MILNLENVRNNTKGLKSATCISDVQVTYEIAALWTTDIIYYNKMTGMDM